MNNKFGDCCDCPALVDGRFFTEYRDRDGLQFDLMKKNNITDSLVFRKYLIENASSLIDSNIKSIEKTHKCNYNKPVDSPSAPINTSYYVGSAFSDPKITLAPFNSIGNDTPSSVLQMTNVPKNFNQKFRK